MALHRKVLVRSLHEITSCDPSGLDCELFLAGERCFAELCSVTNNEHLVLRTGDMFDDAGTEDEVEFSIREWQLFGSVHLNRFVPVLLPSTCEVLFQKVSHNDVPVTWEYLMYVIASTATEVEDSPGRVDIDISPQDRRPVFSRAVREGGEGLTNHQANNSRSAELVPAGKLSILRRTEQRVEIGQLRLAPCSMCSKDANAPIWLRGSLFSPHTGFAVSAWLSLIFMNRSATLLMSVSLPPCRLLIRSNVVMATNRCPDKTHRRVQNEQ